MKLNPVQIRDLAEQQLRRQLLAEAVQAEVTRLKKQRNTWWRRCLRFITRQR